MWSLDTDTSLAYIIPHFHEAVHCGTNLWPLWFLLMDTDAKQLLPLFLFKKTSASVLVIAADPGP